MTNTTEKATPIKIFTNAATMCVSTLHNVHRSHLQTWCSHNKSPDWCVHNRDTPPHAQSTPHQQKVRAREALEEEAKVTLVTVLQVICATGQSRCRSLHQNQLSRLTSLSALQLHF